jgi:hypothetical protein
MLLKLSLTFFILSNFSVAPFYLMMMAAPRARRTHILMYSLWPVALPALVYVIFLVLILSFTRPDVLGLWGELYIEKGLFNSSTIVFLSDMFGRFPELAILHGWVHVVVGDIFMARWAYLDAVERNTPGMLIAIVAFLIAFIGPVGLVIYLIVRRGYRLKSLQF